MRRALVALALMLAALGRAAAAQSVPTVQATATPGWPDPFCDVTAYAVPWDATAGPATTDGSAVRVRLYAARGTAIDADVVLVTRDAAYRVKLHDLALSLPRSVRVTAPLLLALPKPGIVRYLFVDTISLDGTTQVQCPTDVDIVRPFVPSVAEPRLDPPSASFVATLDQKLPPLTCAKPYTDARVVHAYWPQIGFYGNGQREAEIEVFVDSDGHVVNTKIWKSSGVAGIDETARAAAVMSTYAPATFLCTPVVGSYLFALTYENR